VPGDGAALEPLLARDGVAGAGEQPAASPALSGAAHSSGDSGGATACTGSTGGGGGGGKPRRRWARDATACCVHGCTEPLSPGVTALQKYALRHRLCLRHLRAERVDTAAGAQRFCQARRGGRLPARLLARDA
jgi:hypothetical protein